VKYVADQDDHRWQYLCLWIMWNYGMRISKYTVRHSNSAGFAAQFIAVPAGLT